MQDAIERDLLSDEARRWGQAMIDRGHGSLIVDQSLFVTDAGNLIDLRALEAAKREAADWASRTVPGQMLHMRDFLEARDAPFVAVLRSGSFIRVFWE